MSTLESLLDLLPRRAEPGGGWGYRVGLPAHPEPTALALLALSSQRTRHAEIVQAALNTLWAARRDSGAFVFTAGRPEAVWTTALALFAGTRLGLEKKLLEPSAQRLLTIQGRVLSSDPEVADMVDIDVRKVGWPWAENTFAWVEPTAWACFALRAVGLGGSARVRAGIDLLLDRAMDGGGINYGNRVVLGKLTDPIPGPTALFLLACQGIDHPRVTAAQTYLRRVAAESADLDHLAWAVLGLGDAAGPIVDKLDRTAAELLASGVPIATHRLAVAALALSPDRAATWAVEPLPATTDGKVPEPQPEVDPRGGFGQRAGKWMRGLLAKGISALRPLPSVAGVHIAKATEYDSDVLLGVLKSQYEHFRAAAPAAGRMVVLKPNLVEWHRAKVINTDPAFVEAAIRLFQQEGASEVVVAEGPGHWRNVEFLVESSGLGEVLRRTGTRFVDLNHDEPVKVPNLGRLTGMEFLYVTRTVASAGLFVSLPKLKTHHWAGVTLSLKNLFGTMPGICYGWPKNELHWRGLSQSIIDIAVTQTPHLAMVDGVMAMEGDGPLNGTARFLGAVVTGHDLVAVDATCCRLIGIDPMTVPSLRLGAEKGLGRLAEGEIPQLGLPVGELAQTFDLPPNAAKVFVGAARPA